LFACLRHICLFCLCFLVCLFVLFMFSYLFCLIVMVSFSCFCFVHVCLLVCIRHIFCFCLLCRCFLSVCCVVFVLCFLFIHFLAFFVFPCFCILSAFPDFSKHVYYILFTIIFCSLCLVKRYSSLLSLLRRCCRRLSPLPGSKEN